MLVISVYELGRIVLSLDTKQGQRNRLRVLILPGLVALVLVFNVLLYALERNLPVNVLTFTISFGSINSGTCIS